MAQTRRVDHKPGGGYCFRRILIGDCPREGGDNFKAEYAEEFTKVLSDPSIFLYLPESVPTTNDIENLIQCFIEGIRRMSKMVLQEQIWQ